MATINLDPARLAKYVGEAAALPASDYAKECAEEASAMVAGYATEDNLRREPPAAILSRAALEVGAELYHRRTSRNGVAGFGESPDNFTPLRIARDPLKAAYDVLRPYMKAPIG